MPPHAEPGLKLARDGSTSSRVFETDPRREREASPGAEAADFESRRPESERAFARAVELDPGNAMYYPHYVQGAFTVHHDSALAARRIADLPKRQWRETYQTPMNIAFGDSTAQAAALARLDSVRRATGGVLGLSMPLYRSPLYQEPLEGGGFDATRRKATGTPPISFT